MNARVPQAEALLKAETAHECSTFPQLHKSTLTLRKVALLAHRYVGLTIMVFLIVAGLTGSIVAFYHELDVALSPALYRVEPSAQRRSIDPFTLRDRATEHLPQGATIPLVPLDTPPGEAVGFWVELPEDLDAAGHHTEYFFDPYSGALNGTRRWGDPRAGKQGLMSFILSLHYTLALGDVGKLLLGLVALLWTLDCFVGAYLTFPPSSSRRATKRAKSRLSRWKPAWLLRANKLFSLVFTWHRASGLWLWGMLLVFSWSAVGLNLYEVYQPVMRAVYGPANEHDVPKLAAPLERPALSFRQAHDEARRLMTKEAEARGIDIYAERMLRYLPAAGRYEYRVYSSRDISKRYATSTLWLDGNTGQMMDFMLPTGDNLGATVTTWIYQLHFGTITAGGWPYRIFVSLLGIAVALLSASGLWIWSRRRRRISR
jgi:uncharacterized iron-regulated membrane protein